MYDVIRGLVTDGVTVLLTTQYLDEADQLADHIAVVDHGRVIADGTAADLKARTGALTLAVRPVDRRRPAAADRRRRRPRPGRTGRARHCS